MRFLLIHPQPYTVLDLFLKVPEDILLYRDWSTALSATDKISRFNPDLFLSTADVVPRFFYLLAHPHSDPCNSQLCEVVENSAVADFLLSPRQTELIRLLRAGLRNKEIAAYMHVSKRTVKGYLTRLFQIFHVSNRTELIGAITVSA